MAYKKDKLFKASDYWSRYMLNFDFVEKGLGIVSPLHLVYDSSRKMFLVLYSINRPNFIVWLPLILEILVNMRIAIVCFPGCDVINIKINLIFLIKLFFTWPKSQDKNLNTSGWKELLRWNEKHFPAFFTFCQTCPRPEYVSFKMVIFLKCFRGMKYMI